MKFDLLLKCFTLHVMNLEYMKVSLFEISYKKNNFFMIFKFFEMHLCIYIYIYIHIVFVLKITNK